MLASGCLPFPVGLNAPLLIVSLNLRALFSPLRCVEVGIRLSEAILDYRDAGTLQLTRFAFPGFTQEQRIIRLQKARQREVFHRKSGPNKGEICKTVETCEGAI